MMKKFILLAVILLLNISLFGQSKRIIKIPDIPGYQTLKCDFHMHTVFSDGTVWPTVRIQEAAREGLDAIAITDHIEYLPHSKDIKADHNRSYEIAKPLADEYDILLVQGVEITRSMPPGHLNALFVSNGNLIDREEINDAIKEARDQGAFLIWNHPCWESQQPDTVLWWDEHSWLLDNNMLHGIEVYNSRFCTKALSWAVEKNLTMFGNTDVHGPLNNDDALRPMTLVFSRSRTIAGIKDALFKQRAVVFFNNTLVGNAEFVEPLFFESLSYSNAPVRLRNEQSETIRIVNHSDIDYELELVHPGVGFDAPESVMLKAGYETALKLDGNSTEIDQSKNIQLYYQVKNIFTNVDENLIVTFSFRNN